jgi:hypothetical protein
LPRMTLGWQTWTVLLVVLLLALSLAALLVTQ